MYVGVSVWLVWSGIGVAGFYFTSYLLNMFRTLIYPSSGACDYSVELPHWRYCSLFRCVLEFRCGWVGMVSVLQAKTCDTDTTIYLYPEPDRSSLTPHSTSWRSILTLSSNLRLGLPSGLFPSGFPTKTLYTHLLSYYKFCIPHVSHSFRFYHPNNIGWGVQIIKLLVIQSLPFPPYLVSLRPKYFPQHPVLKHPQATKPKFNKSNKIIIIIIIIIIIFIIIISIYIYCVSYSNLSYYYNKILTITISLIADT